MTVKLNFNSVINHFVKKDIAIAKKLYNLTKQAEEAPFESAFLKHQDLKAKIDSLDKKSTLEQFNDAKNQLAKVIQESDQFSSKERLRHLMTLQKISTPYALMSFFYNYIQAAEGQKVIGNINQTNFKKVAEVLVEIADQLDQEQPELAKEADLLLEELVKTAAGGCSNMEMGHTHTESCMDWRPEMERQLELEDFDAATEDEVAIEEIQEPAPEYDSISLEDLEERLSGMKFRVADRHRREMLEKALVHAQKAKQYYDAYKKYKHKTHSIFDDAGEAFRLKDFE